MTNKNIVIEKILNLPEQQITEVLFFMAGLIAGCNINMQADKIEQSNNLHNEWNDKKSEGGKE